jgi:cell division protein FtsB
MPSPFARPGLRRKLVVLGLAALAVWVGLLDSHSVWRRVAYYRELSGLTDENARLRAENDALAAQVRAGLSPATVEEVAREQYGMRRPGETVYPVVAPAEED